MGIKRRRARSSGLGLPLLALLLLLAPACGDDDPTEPPPGNGAHVRVDVRYTVNGRPLELETGRYLAASGDSFYVSRVRHYLTNFQFTSADTNFVDTRLHYVDAEQLPTLRFLIPNVPRIEYVSLAFLIGLDDARNRLGGIAEPTLDDLNMEWPIPLGGGYHNIQIEGFYWREGVARRPFNAHLGRAQESPSQGTPYINHNVPVLLRDVVFTETDGARSLSLEMEIDQWFRTPQVYDFATWGNFIMDRHEPQQILRENAADAFNVAR